MVISLIVLDDSWFNGGDLVVDLPKDGPKPQNMMKDSPYDSWLLWSLIFGFGAGVVTVIVA